MPYSYVKRPKLKAESPKKYKNPRSGKCRDCGQLQFISPSELPCKDFRTPSPRCMACGGIIDLPPIYRQDRVEALDKIQRSARKPARARNT